MGIPLDFARGDYAVVIPSACTEPVEAESMDEC
jgi:hypothetical protein